MTTSPVTTIIDEQVQECGTPAQDAMRKRFDQIEDEVARGKHTAMSVFTQMRTAALYNQPAQTELVILLKRVTDELDALNCAYRDAVDECPEPEEERELCDATDELVKKARAALAAQGGE